MYWFRHWTPIYNWIMLMFSQESYRKSLQVNDKHGKKDIIKCLELYIARNSPNISIKHHEVNISLYEDKVVDNTIYVKAQPFFSFTTPSSCISLSCEHDVVKATMFGFSLTCSKPSIFIEGFIKTAWSTFSASILSGFLKRYYAFYEGIMRRLARYRNAASTSDARSVSKNEEDISDVPESDSEESSEPDPIEKVNSCHSRANCASMLQVGVKTYVESASSLHSGKGSTTTSSILMPVSILSRCSNSAKKKKAKKSVRFDSGSIDQSNDRVVENGKENPIPSKPEPIIKPPRRESHSKPAAFKQSSIPAELSLRSCAPAKLTNI